MNTANVMPGLNLLLALDSGDPLSVLSAAASFIPVWGPLISLGIGLLGSLFGDDDIPMREGLAHAQWDAHGHTQVVTTQDAEGGGATASSWMNSLVSGLQTRLDQTVDANGQAQYGLVPGLLPSVGFKYDPDGFNLANGAKGFMYLQWTDENGQTQTRYYDGAGDRGDGSGETLAGDFMQHAQGAIAPAWQVQTVLAHYQQTGQLDLPEQSSSLPTELAGGLQQTLQVVSLALPNALPSESTPNNTLIDVDGDGYLEKTQWLQSNQAVLAVDLNGDGQISVGERVSLQGAGQAAQTRTSMGWLDANGDGRLTAQDPAFAALKLWIDVNQDGQSQNGEVQSVSQAGITAMDFSTNPPSIERADGSQQALMVQDLTADTLGVALQQTAGGMVETTEQQDGSGRSVLHAVNTREFDGQAAHTHGGDQDVDGSNGQVVQVDDSRLATTTNNTIANSSTQTSTTVGVGDSRLRSAAPLTATVITTTNNANNTRVVFVPAGQTSAQKEIVSVTNSMIESAQSSLFGESAGSSFAGPGVLTAVSMGATVSAASAANAAEAADVAQGSVSNVSTSNTPAAASASSDAVSWTQVNLGGSALPKQPSNTGPSNTSNTSSTSIISTATTTSSTAPVAGLGSTSGASTEPLFVWATVITSANSISSNSTTANATTPTSPLPIAASTAPSVDTSVAASSLSLGYPVVQAETLQGTEDVVLRLTQSVLLANDSTPNASADLNAPALTITAVSQPLHGQVSLVNGEVLFTPDSNFHGTASFTYTVTDQYGLSTNSTATLEIAAVNDAPVAQGELVSSDEDIGLIFTQAQLLTNDTDVDVATDGQVLTISRVGLAEHGTVLLDALGQVRFVPDLNYNGPAQFTYWISDGLAANGAGAEVPATVNLTILAVNDVPVVTGETVNTNEDTTLLFNPATLLANDTDVDVATNGQVLSITAVNNATHGTVAFVTQSDGSQRIAFTPEANFFGMASYQYTVSDGNGGTATTTVVVNLAAVNDAPDVVADTLSATEDTPLSWVQNALLANDSDVDNPHTDLRIVGVSNATHGSVSLNPDGSIRFEPELDYFGAATFNYTVGDGVGGFSVGTATVNIAPVNDNPVAVGESLTLNEDEVATLSVASLLTNDTDVDNAHVDLSIQSVGNATHGSVSLVTTNGTTSVVFKPELNFNGIASFTYTVSDGVGGTATTSMRLDFTSVNDLPVVNNELFMGKRNVNYSLSTAALLANDIDVETSTANLTVASVGNAQHGTVSLVNGNVVFVPEAGYSGRGSFDYVVQDADGGQSTATTQIDFSRINVNPVAVDDSFNGFEDVPLSITQAQLLVNDSDSDNASLHVSHLGSATNGTVAFDAQGNVVFTPDANFYGQASFTYQVSDGDGGSTWATASLSVASVNDAPIIEDVWYGRPIYGYKWYANVSTDEQGSYTGHWWTLEPVTSESEARALQANPNDLVYAVGVPNWPWVTDLSRRNDLMNSAGAVLPPSYYLNGQIKPIAFNSLDAAAVDEYGSVVSISNDAYRQNGSVVAYDPDGDSSALTFSIGSTPTHGHAWANQYTSLYAPEQLDHTQAGAYWSTEKGAWQYYSSRGDTYNGTDSFQVSVRDSAGASTSVTVNATHTGSSHAGGGGKKPVTLDLNGDGLQYIGLDDSKAYFDVNDDGWRERMAWVGAGDGLLALDTQGDHTIDKWNEISFVSYKEGARSDLEGLQAFDSSGNGKLDRLDARWNEFGAWVDANANGVCETGEFKTLDELRIVSIDLTSDQQVASPVFGVTELGQSKFTTADGKTHAVGDVVFAVDAHDRLPSRVLDGLALQRPEPGQEAVLQKSDADRHLAEVIRQAMLFNQMVNTVIVSNEPPLSFVANELLTQDWRQIELQGAVDPFSAPRVSAS
jgi:PIN domain nuclease of toxin-antitoxin system